MLVTSPREEHVKIWARKVPGGAEAVGAREGPDQMAQGCEDIKGEFGFYSETGRSP